MSAPKSCFGAAANKKTPSGRSLRGNYHRLLHQFLEKGSVVNHRLTQSVFACPSVPNSDFVSGPIVFEDQGVID